MKIRLKNKDYVLIAFLIVLLLFIRLKLINAQSHIELSLNDQKSTMRIETQELMIIHITGAVHSPGVYEIPENERLQYLITEAGGLSNEADHSRINLARVLEDGLKIHIPYISSKKENNDMSTDHKLTLTDFNNLSQIELTAIDGIGEVISKRIIDYKTNNGPFLKISDLLKVNGIGPSKLEQIKKFVY